MRDWVPSLLAARSACPCADVRPRTERGPRSSPGPCGDRQRSRHVAAASAGPRDNVAGRRWSSGSSVRWRCAPTVARWRSAAPSRARVLAVLALHANQPVSAERLAVALWGEDAPPGAVKTVQVYVSRLRKALGDAGGAGDHAGGLPPAWCGPGELDAERFERAVAAGRRGAGRGRRRARGRAAARGAGAVARTAAGGVRVGAVRAGRRSRAWRSCGSARVEVRVEADLAAGRARRAGRPSCSG